MYRIEIGGIEPEFYGYRHEVAAVTDALMAHGVKADWPTLRGILSRMAAGSCLSFQGTNETVFVERTDPRLEDPASTLQDRCAARHRNRDVFVVRVDEDRLARWAVFEGTADDGPTIRVNLALHPRTDRVRLPLSAGNPVEPSQAERETLCTKLLPKPSKNMWTMAATFAGRTTITG